MSILLLALGTLAGSASTGLAKYISNPTIRNAAANAMSTAAQKGIEKGVEKLTTKKNKK